MKRLLLARCSSPCALPATAGEFPSLGSLGQDQFRSLSEDLGAAFSYKGVTPATPLGPTGFDIGLEVSATDIQQFRSLPPRGQQRARLHRRARSSTSTRACRRHRHRRLRRRGLDRRERDGVRPRRALCGARRRRRDAGGRAARFRARAPPTWAASRSRRWPATSWSPRSSRSHAVHRRGRGAHDSPKPRASASRRRSSRKSRVFAGLNVNFAMLNLAVEAEKMGSNTTLSAKAGWRF